ncbi:MAG: prolipoprotein diacylglyceryl transferase [Lentisphaerae bacterium]|nr:prolipoprotein diacylglyceryl transferase [Lentisphaerota bacterium]
MHPVFFHLGGLTISWYGVMMALAFVAGLINWTLLGRREGRSYTDAADMLFWVMVSGILGARVAYIFKEWDSFSQAPVTMLFLHKGGLAFYGGFIGGTLALAVFARVRGQKVLSLYDFAVTSLPLGHALGRVGCFLNGCCFGRVFDGAMSVTYPAHSHPWWRHVYSGDLTRFDLRSLPVHPIQIYEALFNVLLFVVLVRSYRRRKRDGSVAALYLMTYPLGRFVFEYFRGDHRLYVMGVSVGQVVSFLLFSAGAALWFLGRRGMHETDAGR